MSDKNTEPKLNKDGLEPGKPVSPADYARIMSEQRKKQCKKPTA